MSRQYISAYQSVEANASALVRSQAEWPPVNPGVAFLEQGAQEKLYLKSTKQHAGHCDDCVGSALPSKHLAVLVQAVPMKLLPSQFAISVRRPGCTGSE